MGECMRFDLQSYSSSSYYPVIDKAGKKVAELYIVANHHIDAPRWVNIVLIVDSDILLQQRNSLRNQLWQHKLPLPMHQWSLSQSNRSMLRQIKTQSIQHQRKSLKHPRRNPRDCNRMPISCKNPLAVYSLTPTSQ